MPFVKVLVVMAALSIALTAAAHSARVSGEFKLWHSLTLSFEGPETSETAEVNPFLDYRLDVTFHHPASGKTYRIPGYYAANGRAGDTSASSGSAWRAHFSADEPGVWRYSASFRTGKDIAVSDEADAGKSAGFFDGYQGSFEIAASDKQWPDFRARGRLQYVGLRYLQFAGTGEYFLKAGPDAPETLLAYEEFDGTYTYKTPLKSFRAHLRDWKPGDPVWKGGKGRGIIGALNYLSSKGMNTFSFLTYNAGGDGCNVWPFIRHDAKTRYDCSKLDQWRVVFEHAQRKGLHMTIKLQETENDHGVPEALDGGELGTERRLYFREMIARFGHLMALTWNIGEENNQPLEQQKAQMTYFATHDPYKHNIAIHTYPGDQEKVYKALLGNNSDLTGASLQNGWSEVHNFTLWWVWESKQAGRPWVVANDEQNGADTGVPPDPGYEGFDPDSCDHNIHDIRRETLWGNLMAGGAGVEYYFGYSLPCDDLICENWRCRDRSWDYARIALEFFRTIPIERLFCNDRLTKAEDDFCFYEEGQTYLVYKKNGGAVEFELPEGSYTAGWFNPRTGDGMTRLLDSSDLRGPVTTNLIAPDSEDWLLVVRRK